MIIDIKVPELPDSVTEATIGNWNKKVGEYINQGENLVDLETDKVILDLPAPNSGIITEIIKENGSIVVSGQIIAKINTEATASVDNSDASKVVEEKVEEKNVAIETEKIAMPAASKIAKENELDLNKITGSGKDGRILKEDIITNKEKDKQPQVSQSVFSSIDIPAISISSDRPEQRVPMSRLRQRVAQRLIQSQRENAILTTFNEVNMKPIMDLRNKYKDTFLKKHNIKLGFMSFFVKASVMALQKFPVVNASIDNNDIIYHGYFDIGIAVSSPRGLVVPILRNVDSMSLADIEKQIADYAVKAKEGKLTLDELTGGTFSITNGGTFGSMMSTPIINPPQSAILGMHSIKERAVVENGEIVVRPMMYLALSYDHRLIDGREAVLTLVTIKEMLEDPSRIVLDV